MNFWKQYTLIMTVRVYFHSTYPRPTSSDSLHMVSARRFLLHFRSILSFRSQTSWIWLETKLVELGMVGSSRNYQVNHIFVNLINPLSRSRRYHLVRSGKTMSPKTDCFIVLDKTCMFTVFSQRNNKPWNHSVKALQIIWNHFSQL